MAMSKIPTVEQNLLGASLYINNFKRVVEELVYNSLDAGASSIAIRIFIQENFIQVLDNGNGISKDNFSLLGHKYATSKYVNIATLKSAPDKYGYKGLSLASIIGVSETVQISSRYENSDDTWMKTFYNGKEKDICKTVLRPSKGTTIQIKGFLYNLNIQRKSIDPHTEILNIISVLKQLSLVHWNVSISLRDDSKNDIIFRIHKNRTVYDTLRSVFDINENDFQELQVEKNEYRVQAFVGKSFQESYNDYQFIYVNGKTIHKSVLHKKLNEILSKSLTTRHNKVKTKHMYENENNFNRNIPFYFLFITCPNYDFEIVYNNGNPLVEFKEWNEVNKLLEKLVQFYNGNLVFKKKEISKNGVEEDKSIKKKQIKEIMEKILNSKNKHAKISHVPNGVKGKILKRNRKKKWNLITSNMLHKKIEINDQCQAGKNPKSTNIKKSVDHFLPKPIESKKAKESTLKKTKRHMNVFNDNYLDEFNEQKEIHNSNNVKQITDQLNQEPKKLKKAKHRKLIMSTSLPKKVLTSQDAKKKKKKHLKGIKNLNCLDNIIERFEAPTGSFNKRCNHLYGQLQKFLGEKEWLKKSLYGFINKNQYERPKKRARRSSLNNTTNTVAHNGNHVKINHLNHEIVKKSYDLLKPVNFSQDIMIDKKNTRTTFNNHCDGQEINYNYNKIFIPMETFHSHKYDSINGVQRKGGFISETTRNSNFCMNDDNFFSNKIQYNQQDQEFSHYTIEMSDIRELDECTRLGNKHYSSREDENYIKSFRYSDTYTLKNYNDTYTVKETYSLVTLNTFNFHPHAFKKMLPSTRNVLGDNVISNNCESEKNNFTINESNSDNSEIFNIEPLNYVKAVLCSSNYELRDIEKEFENSFAHNKNENIEDNMNLITDLNTFKCNQDLCISQSHIDNNINSLKSTVAARVDCKNIESHTNINQEMLAIRNNENECDVNYNFQLKERRSYIPKGMSQIIYNRNEHQNASEVIADEVYYKDMIYKNFANDVLLNAEILEPELQNIKKLDARHKEKANTEQEQHADLIFDALSLTQAKVILGQVDRKFIVSILNGRSTKTDKSSEFLVLFDQHAVDERIRLEKNLQDYIQFSKWNSVDIYPVSIQLNKDDYVYFVNHSDKFTRFGLHWTSTSDYKILLNAIPKAILGKYPRQVEIIMKTVKKFILEQIKAIKYLRGNVSMYPKSIMELVFSEACRYAIKFGDKLSKRECVDLINSLSCCKTPFQCAHGRPVIAVLMEIENTSREYKVNLTKIKKFKENGTI